MQYPEKSTQPYGWGMMGYESAMIHRAVMSDDPDGFMRFAKEMGLGSQTFYGDTLIGYAAKHGAGRCLKALWDAGENDDHHSKDEWLEICAEAPYGPDTNRYNGGDNLLLSPNQRAKGERRPTG